MHSTRHGWEAWSVKKNAQESVLTTNIHRAQVLRFQAVANDQSNICFRRELHMLQHHRARYRHIALSGLFDNSGLRRRPTGHADSSGVAGGEGSSTMACIIPSADHGSVVSRMGITNRISLNGALGGSGGSIVNSMKSLRARSCKSDPCAPPRQVCCAP